jgi:hypothetical protein
MKSHATQRNRILELLTSARGGWVPLPEIAQRAAQYNARILELRRMGYRIPAPRTRSVNGQRHTWYRIELKGGTSASPGACSAPGLSATAETLLPLAELERTARWEDHG